MTTIIPQDEQQRPIIIRQVNPDAIIVKEEYLHVIRPLSTEEYESLKQSILQDPKPFVLIHVNEKYIILDGYHRYLICRDEGLNPYIHVHTFNSDTIAENDFILRHNIARRHLSDSEKYAHGYDLLKTEEEKARGRQIELAGTRKHDNDATLVPIGTKVETGRAVEIVAKKIGGKPRTLQRYKHIFQNGSEELKKKLLQGQITPYQACNQIKNQRIMEELKKQAEAEPPVSKHDISQFKLILSDFREACKNIPNNSIDLLYTDPPYAKDKVYLYNDLGEVGFRLLKEGGSLVTYFGQGNLPDVIDLLKKSRLNYWWMFEIIHTGHIRPAHEQKVNVGSKPLLWFVKGRPVYQQYFSDTVFSQPPDKSALTWSQSPVEAEHFIKALTVENQIVLDPFMGTATTGIAALYVKRQFIGIEINTETFLEAERKIAVAVSTLQQQHQTQQPAENGAP